MTVQPRLLDDPYFPRLKALVIETTGMAFYADKDDDLARILGDRMAEIGVGGCARYLERLEDTRLGKDEMDALVAELTIGETYFFRHKEQFTALRERILPDVIARNADSRRIRIWSAGCATGPEPYSLAILLRREFGMSIAGWHVSIIGTDINQKFLSRAREGRYEDWAFRATPDDIRAECFDKAGKHWLIKPEYKACVSFQYHNLITSRFPSLIDNIAGFDIIVCRNVVIYFSRETVARLVPCFHETLVDGGWLVMGHAEPNLELFRSFRTVNAPGAVLYQRQDTALAKAPAIPPVLGPSRPSPVPAQVRPPARQRPRPSPPAAAPTSAGFMAEVRRLADGGHWDVALKSLDDLIVVNNLDPKLHFYRALVLEQVGDWEESEKALKRCIYLDRHFVLPHYHLGLFHSRNNDVQAARRFFRNALALLERFPDDHALLEGDDVTAGQVREAVEMHLKLIGTA